MKTYYIKFYYDHTHHTTKVWARNLRAAKKEALAFHNRIFNTDWKRLPDYTKVWPV